MVALLSANDEFDYFGYMKKMMLTLHNVRKINKNNFQFMGQWFKSLYKVEKQKYRCYG